MIGSDGWSDWIGAMQSGAVQMQHGEGQGHLGAGTETRAAAGKDQSINGRINQFPGGFSGSSAEPRKDVPLPPRPAVKILARPY